MLRRGALSLLLVAMVALAGCSQDAQQPGTDSARRQGRSSETGGDKTGHPGGGSKSKRPGPGSADSKSSKRSDGGSGASQASGGNGGSSNSNVEGGSASEDATSAGGGETGAKPWAMRSDPPGDADRQGQTPAYSDIRSATISGSGSTVSFTLQTDGPPPQSLADGIDMTASFHFKMNGGDEHHIYAMGGKRGWKADMDNSGEFPGRFAVDDNRFVFELPWDRLGGPSTFKWLAQTSWTRWPKDGSDDSDFAFDQVPEYEEASFPE